MTITYPNQKAKVRVSEWHTDLMDVWAELIKEMRRTSFRAIDTFSYPEEYQNHLGIIDNFTETVIVSTASATPNSTTHSMDLSGSGDVASAWYRTKKQWTVSEFPIILSFIIANMSNAWCVGLTSAIWPDNQSTAIVVEDWTGTSDHRLHMQSGGFYKSVSLGYTIQNGDVVTLICTLKRILCYVNYILYAQIDNTDPDYDSLDLSAPMYVGGQALGINETTGTLSVDMINVKVFQ